MNRSETVLAFEKIVGTENVRLNELLKNHTSFKLGGPADIFLTPRNAEQLGRIIGLCNSNQVPFFIMGNGTNLIVRDKGIRGVVIKVFENFREYSVEGEMITAEAGLLLSQVANIALENELAGFEFASGIPGTLGGAVTMNAGAYIGEMKDVVCKTEYMDREGNLKTLEGEAHQFAYRKSFIQEAGGIVLKTQLRLKKGIKADIKNLMDDLNQRRKDKQPLHMPSAGSVFKRPEGYFAGKLIEDCGLRGFRLGGAEVSEMHCGFIVNADNATAEDVLKLIAHIQKAVKEKFGVMLEREVRIVGEE
ncbi:MAG: UDP-N-acetylmuramate dehydrogenase [Clostridia bacterium]|nr:UDP-N-acetylmuramate dehydrogenase [Clostridia bacterium]